ncbi:Ppx/GppA phosphatase family protein [Ideonella livida]|uniref:Ppx/GppA family phosphatase n=1 Tax=Ideonella livida TaxID=2707176 RepID=A0A7C9PKV4_9BURK|nr:Ppx/GppA phosphatase family protein [Ideonella livida]NDY93870.1 Ppx/GppA family phosphatase [Ideonella livida]
MNAHLPAPDAPLASIDMGSNSFRLEIGQVLQQRYRRLAYLKDTVRLGAGLDANGYLTEEATQRGLESLRGFAHRLQGFGPGQVRAVATQTLREARNRNDFLARAETVLGFPIEVISGREEARLIYAGVSFMQPARKPRLVIDIGGRSTEMILGTGRTPGVAESFQVGSVSLSMRWFPDGALTRQAFRDAEVAAGAEIEEALGQFAPNRWEEALGSSGTAGAVSQILAGAGVSDGTITPAGLRWCIEQCLAAGHVDRLNLPTLKEDRKPVIAGGLALLYTLAMHFGLEELKPAKGALRQGVLIDLHERHEARRGDQPGGRDLRDGSVSSLQQRFGADPAQAERVRLVALSLYEQLAQAQDAADEALLELGWACALHEVGMMVSHHDHHRHSAYLLAHADAPGFSQNQQRRMADLVLGQRGGLRKLEAALAQERFAHQVLALRLAVIKCHARGPVHPGALSLKRSGRTVTVGSRRGWAEQNPRTAHLLRDEAEAWSRLGVLKLVLNLR